MAQSAELVVRGILQLRSRIGNAGSDKRFTQNTQSLHLLLLTSLEKYIAQGFCYTVMSGFSIHEIHSLFDQIGCFLDTKIRKIILLIFLKVSNESKRKYLD